MLPKSYTVAMAKKAADFLTEAKAVECKQSDRLERVIFNAFAEELAVEEKLREEADGILAAQRSAIRSSGADINSLREKIVAKLAKDRGLILR